MQAQREPPIDMICKDKFLVQATVVPEETSEDDIISEMFSKGDGKYVQENKLRVVLVTPSSSPVESSPMNEVCSHLATDVLADGAFGSAKLSTFSELGGNMELKQENDMELEGKKLLVAKAKNDVGEMESFKEMMKSKLHELELQLSAAEATIARLTQERQDIAQETEGLRRELAVMTSKKVVRRVQVGFPLEYVVMVAVIGITIGCLLGRL